MAEEGLRESCSMKNCFEEANLVGNTTPGLHFVPRDSRVTSLPSQRYKYPASEIGRSLKVCRDKQLKRFWEIEGTAVITGSPSPQSSLNAAAAACYKAQMREGALFMTCAVPCYAAPAPTLRKLSYDSLSFELWQRGTVRTCMADVYPAASSMFSRQCSQNGTDTMSIRDCLLKARSTTVRSRASSSFSIPNRPV